MLLAILLLTVTALVLWAFTGLIAAFGGLGFVIAAFGFFVLLLVIDDIFKPKGPFSQEITVRG